MTEKRRGLVIPSFSFRAILLVILLPPAMAFFLFLILTANTPPETLICGIVALISLLAAWSLGERLLIRRLDDLHTALHRFDSPMTEYPVSNNRGVSVETLTAYINKAADEAEKRCNAWSQEIETLRQGQKQWTRLIDALPDPTFVIDRNGKVLVWNHAIVDLTGVQTEEMIGKQDREYAIPFYGERRNMLIDYVFLPPEEIEGRYQAVKRSGDCLYGEGTIMAHRSAKPIYFWGMASAIYDDSGNTIGAIETIRDISEYKEIENALRDGQAKYQVLFDSANDAVTLMINDTFIDCNQKALQLFGCTKEDFVGQTPQRFSPAQQPDGKSSTESAMEKISSALAGTPQFFHWTHCRLDGKTLDTEISLDAVKLANGEVIIQSIIRDITERKQAEETIRQFAYHDPLTGLPNRRLLYDRFHMEIDNAVRGKRMFSVMMFDIDHFKAVNDNLGHHTGDLLLQNVAYRIRSNLRKGDTLARFGGDEFIVILPEVSREEDANNIALKILRTFKKPFNCADHDIFVTTSIGIALYPSDGQDMETLIRHADRALYRSKDTGRNTFTFFGTLSPNENDTRDEKPVFTEPGRSSS